MNEKLSSFKWPIPNGEIAESKWEGHYFQHSSGKKSGVISCTEACSNWSDELTLLHEAEAGQGDHPIDRASREMAVRTLREYLEGKNSVVMDVGCSSGFLLEDLRKHFPEVSLIGADYLTGLLERLSQKLTNIPLLQFDLRNSPLENKSLDAVTCINVLEHIDDDQKALCEIYRILRPGGIAHIEVPSSPSCYDIYDEHLMHHRRYTMSGLIKKCRNAGFSVLHKTHLGAFVFPAFYIVKKRNRGFLKSSNEEKSKRVKAMISKTRSSRVMQFVSRIELIIGKYVSYPLGIRCVVIVQKNNNE